MAAEDEKLSDKEDHHSESDYKFPHRYHIFWFQD